MTDEFRNDFIEEALELLNQLETDLLHLEENTDDRPIIDSIFRIMHNLKGTAGMFGFDKVQNLTHDFESLYDQIKEGKLSVTDEIISITLKGKDLLHAMLDINYAGNDDEAIRAMISMMLPGESTRAKSEEKTSIKARNNFVVIFTPDSKIFERGLDPDKVLLEIKDAGWSHCIVHHKGKDWKTQKSKKDCQTKWEIYLNTTLTFNEVEETFLFYDRDEFMVFEIPENTDELPAGLMEKIGQLYDNNDSPGVHIKEQLGMMEDNNMADSEKDEIISDSLPDEIDKKAPIPSQKSVKGNAAQNATGSTVHVSSQKLDELMNLVSELVTSTATLEANTSGYKDDRLKNSIENLEKLTKKFRNNALDLRLIPVGTLLNKFKRQVRDLSKSLGKSVNLIIDGGDIEIDKTILKSIENPLLHIIRNSIDHGIESPEERLQSGKHKEGSLKISAFYSGANVIIQVQDDGRGINLEKVKECAISKGYIQPDQQVTDQELLQLILEPGFTTSDNISIVSGRGVGMDVVRKEMNAVSGSIDIETEKGLGTSIILKLPTTLSIIDTLLIEVNSSPILIPMLDVEYCYKEKRVNLKDQDSRFVQYKNSPVPYISLREKFRVPDHDSDSEMVIIINKFDKRYAIIADKLLGEHQAVIKPLGELFVNQPYFSGGSIMVDGKLALILDTNFLFNQIATN